MQNVAVLFGVKFVKSVNYSFIASFPFHPIAVLPPTAHRTKGFLRLTNSGFSQSAFKRLVDGGFITSNHLWTSLTKYYISAIKPENILIGMDT